MRTGLVAVVVAGVATAAFGVELKVPADYAGIQQALDAARPGDTVRVAAGTYSETITFPSGVALEGEGAETTFLQVDAAKGVLVTATDVKDIRVSGMTIQHDAREEGDDRQYPDLVLFTNAAGVLKDCVLQKSAGCGVVACKGSAVTVEHCTSVDHVQAGVLLKDEGSSGTVTDSECGRNGYSGVWIRDGATGTIQKSRCNENKYSGIYLYSAPGVVIRDNECNGNQNSGIVVSWKCSAEIAGNRIAENDPNGIYIVDGGKGTVTGNTCANSTYDGIHVRHADSEAEISGNTVSGNKKRGIVFCYGARGNASGNTVLENKDAGIAVSQWYTDAVLENNDCNENGAEGIHLFAGCGGSAVNNRCRANKTYGVLLEDEGTAATMSGNVCDDNVSGGEARADGVPANRQDQTWDLDTGYLLRKGMYDRLEEVAQRLRTGKYRYLASGWQLNKYYECMDSESPMLHTYKRKAFEKAMKGWLAAYPDSLTARVIQARAYVNYAWAARGNGMASEVTEKGWAGFNKYLKEAEKVLDEGERLGGDDPELYTAWLSVGLGLDYSKERMNALLKKGTALDVSYDPLYRQYMTSLYPRWGGRPGDLEKFITETGDRTQPECGDQIYAELVYLTQWWLNNRVYQEGRFCRWERVDNGYTQAEKAFPEPNGLLTEHFIMACLYGQRERAKALLDTLGDGADVSRAQDEDMFKRCKRWASGMDVEVVESDDGDEVYSSTFAPGRMKVILIAGGGLAVFLLFLAVLVVVAIVAGNRARETNRGVMPPPFPPR